MMFTLFILTIVLFFLGYYFYYCVSFPLGVLIIFASSTCFFFMIKKFLKQYGVSK